MKKHRNKYIGRCVFSTLLLTGGYFFIFKTISYAEESLISLQNDIVAAKQKHETFSGKIDSINKAMDQKKSQALQNEAENLITELTKSGYSHSQRPLISEEAAPAVGKAKTASPVKSERKEKTGKPEEKISSKEVLTTSEKPSGYQIKPFDFTTTAGSKLPWIFRPTKLYPFQKPEEATIAEGDALYRVAISDKKITLKEAIEIAVANNIEVKSLKKKVEVAQAKWTEAKRAMFPTLQFQIDENGGHSPSGQRFYRGRAYKANINQPLYYGGELVLTAKQAEESLKSSKAELEKAKGEFIHQVRTSYYGVVKAEYNVQYQVELFREVAALYKLVREMRDQKLIAEIDFLNAESQYEETYFQVDSSQNDMKSAQLLLHQSMSIDTDHEIPVDLKLNFKKEDLDFNQMLDIYFRQSPDLKMKELAYISAKYGVQVFEAKRQPRFDLRGSYGMIGEVFKDTQAIEDGKADLDLEKEWFLGVKGSMPFGASTAEYDQIKHVYGPTVSAFQGSEDFRHTFKFNLLDRFSDITDEKSARAALYQAEAEWQKAKFEAAINLKDDFYNLQKSLIQIDSSVSKIRYQEKQNAILKYTMNLQETAAASYMEGLSSQSQNRFAFIQAVIDYKLALSNLSASIGDPFYFGTEN